MAFFNDLTTSLQQKWLQFFQVNRSWIDRYTEGQSVQTPDGGRRPPSYLILGVANALEPQLGELMLPFAKLNSDVEALIDALELNFDPDLVLGNRSNTATNPESPRDESSEEVAPLVQEPFFNDPVIEAVNIAAPERVNDMSLTDTADVVVPVESDEDFMVLNIAAPERVNDMSLTDTADAVVPIESDDDFVVLNVSELDELGDMLLDDTDSAVVLVESDDDSMMVLNVSELDELNDMLLDDTDNAVVLVESDDDSMMVLNVSEFDELDDMLLDDTDSAVAPVESDDDSMMVLNISELDELNDMLLDDTDSAVVPESNGSALETPSAAQSDMFGDISFDEIDDTNASSESDEESLKTSDAAKPDESDKALSDIWEEKMLADSDRGDNEPRSKDKNQFEQDREISRLFPNL